MAVLLFVHKAWQIYWGIPVKGERVSCLKKLKFFILLCNDQIYSILIWILFTIAVQPVYVLLMQLVPTQHVILVQLIDVKDKYCYINSYFTTYIGDLGLR